jgi:hypothetical protein
MKALIGFTIASGLLVSEIRDFFVFGGFSNVLAYNLFKIYLLVIVFLALGIYLMYSNAHNNEEVSPTPSTPQKNGRGSSMVSRFKRVPSKSPIKTQKVNLPFSD